MMAMIAMMETTVRRILVQQRNADGNAGNNISNRSTNNNAAGNNVTTATNDCDDAD